MGMALVAKEAPYTALAVHYVPQHCCLNASGYSALQHYTACTAGRWHIGTHKWVQSTTMASANPAQANLYLPIPAGPVQKVKRHINCQHIAVHIYAPKRQHSCKPTHIQPTKQHPPVETSIACCAAKCGVQGTCRHNMRTPTSHSVRCGTDIRPACCRLRIIPVTGPDNGTGKVHSK